MHHQTHAPCTATRAPQPPTSCTSRRLSPLSWQAGFFKGLQASFLGLSHIMIQFPLYEALKRDLVRPAHGGGAGGGGGGDGVQGPLPCRSILVDCPIDGTTAHRQDGSD